MKTETKTSWNLKLTPQKINMEPENGGPLEKEIPNLETTIFRFQPLVLGGVSISYNQRCTPDFYVILFICSTLFPVQKKCSKETKVNRFESSLTVVTKTSGCDSQPTSLYYLYFTKQQKQLGKVSKNDANPNSAKNSSGQPHHSIFVHPFVSRFFPSNMDSFITLVFQSYLVRIGVKGPPFTRPDKAWIGGPNTSSQGIYLEDFLED